MLEGTHFAMEKDEKGLVRLRFPGVNFGGDACDPILIAHKGRHMVVREPTSSYWGGIGAGRATSPASWALVRVLWKPERGHYRVEKVIEEVNAGLFWRKAKARLLEALEAFPPEPMEGPGAP